MVTALLKMFSVGGVILNPMIAITFESGLAELGLLPSARPQRWTFALAGALAVSWDFFHRFFTQALLAGKGILVVYGWMLEEGSRLLGIDQTAAVGILASLLAIRLATGAAVGWLAWSLASAVKRRMGEMPDTTAS